MPSFQRLLTEEGDAALIFDSPTWAVRRGAGCRPAPDPNPLSENREFTGHRRASRTHGPPKMLRISVPPCAGSAGRCAIPDPLLRHPFAAFVIETKEHPMRYDIHHEIAELRAELAHTCLSRTERADAKARLAQLLAQVPERKREA